MIEIILLIILLTIIYHLIQILNGNIKIKSKKYDGKNSDVGSTPNSNSDFSSDGDCG